MVSSGDHTDHGGSADDMSDDISIDNTIEIVLPARTEFAATIRVLAASVGADLGFSVDEIDDVRLALNEVFTAAAEHDDVDRVSVSLRPGDGRLNVMAFVVGEARLELDDLAATILASVVENVEFVAGTVSFSKVARESVM